MRRCPRAKPRARTVVVRAVSLAIKLAVKFRPVITGRNLTTVEAGACGGVKHSRRRCMAAPGGADSAIDVPTAIFQPISIRSGTSWNNPETTCYH